MGTLTVHGLTELRLSVPEAGKGLLPCPIAAWHATVGVRHSRASPRRSRNVSRRSNACHVV